VLDDIESSISSGLKAVHIGVPTSDILLKSGARRGRKWLFNEVPRLIEYCKARNVFVSISAEDVSRTPRKETVEYARSVGNAGADRIRLSDTLGLCDPFEYRDLVKAVVEEIGIDVQLHTHNDFGLAMANVIAGVEAGARYVQATVNGWGERVGLAALEIVVVGLKRILGIDTGIETSHLVELSNLVARLFNREIPPWQPIVGRDIFVHESGIHVSATLEDSVAFEPFPPAWVGKNHTIVLGKHSGSRAIHYILAQEGLPISREEATSLLPLVRERAIALKRSLSPQELVDIYREWKGE
jgi:homocitrate synthase NifV